MGKSNSSSANPEIIPKNIQTVSAYMCTELKHIHKHARSVYIHINIGLCVSCVVSTWNLLLPDLGYTEPLKHYRLLT